MAAWCTDFAMLPTVLRAISTSRSSLTPTSARTVAATAAPSCRRASTASQLTTQCIPPLYTRRFILCPTRRQACLVVHHWSSRARGLASTRPLCLWMWRVSPAPSATSVAHQSRVRPHRWRRHRTPSSQATHPTGSPVVVACWLSDTMAHHAATTAPWSGRRSMR